MKMKRRGFLKAAMGGFVGSCLSLPACLRAKPPLTPRFKPGIWAGMEGTDLHEFHVKAHSVFLRSQDLSGIRRHLHPHIWKDLIGENRN